MVSRASAIQVAWEGDATSVAGDTVTRGGLWLFASVTNAWYVQQSMSKCCWLPQLKQLKQLKLPLPLLFFAAAWLAIGAGQGDGGEVCEDKVNAIEGAHLIGMCGTSPAASFHKHPALISLLDLPRRQPAGRKAPLC